MGGAGDVNDSAAAFSKPARDDVPGEVAAPADDDDRAAIENARKLVAFLLRNDDNVDLSSVAPSRTSASVLRQLRALSPVVNERGDDLRLFGTKLAARLAEKQLARNFDALGSLIAPATSRQLSLRVTYLTYPVDGIC